MDYRTAPVEPLFVTLGCGLAAIDPTNGTLLWSVPTDWPITRIFRVGQRLLALTATEVHCVDTETGHVVGVARLDFTPETGIVCGDTLVLGYAGMMIGPMTALVCLTSDGHVQWRGELHDDSARILRMFGPRHEPRGEAELGSTRSAAVGFAFRDAVQQPDRNG